MSLYLHFLDTKIHVYKRKFFLVRFLVYVSSQDTKLLRTCISNDAQNHRMSITDGDLKYIVHLYRTNSQILFNHKTCFQKFKKLYKISYIQAKCFKFFLSKRRSVFHQFQQILAFSVNQLKYNFKINQLKYV